MKYAIVILSGAADEPIEALGGRTPLDAASMPETAALAEVGRVGSVFTSPAGWMPTSEVCLATLFGIDPTRTPIERGPIEALGLGVEVPGTTTTRIDLVCIGSKDEDDAGIIRDHTGGDLTSVEAETLLDDLVREWKRVFGTRLDGFSRTPARGHRSLLMDSTDRAYEGVVTVPPRFVVGEPADGALPAGGDVAVSGLLREMVEHSFAFLDEHEMNRVRRENELLPANLAWIWGPGRLPKVPTIPSQFDLTGLVLAASEAARGIARLVGLDCVEDAASDDLERLGAQAVRAVEVADCVIVHVDAADAAAHDRAYERKTEVLEAADRAIIGPLRSRLLRCGSCEADSQQEGWRMMVVVDHATLCSTGEHATGPVPWVMAGDWIRSAVTRRMTENDALASDVQIEPGHELLEYFLASGLKRSKKRSRRLV